MVEKTIEGRMWEGVRLFWCGSMIGFIIISFVIPDELSLTEILIMIIIYFLISLIEIVVEINEKI